MAQQHQNAQEALNAALPRVRQALADQSDWAKRDPEPTASRGGPVAAVEAVAYEKIIGKNKEQMDLRLGKSSVEVDAPGKVIFDTIWSIDSHRPGGWDTPTVKEQSVIDEPQPGKVQVLYVVHKILSAASAPRDLVIARSWQQEPNNGYLIWYTSITHPKVSAKKEGHVRAEQLFAGYLIEPLSPSKCRLTCVSVLDFGAWIHEKFCEGEVVRVAQRLSKIKNIAQSKAPK